MGGLATSGLGDEIFDDLGKAVKKSKSDILVEVLHAGGVQRLGISVKTCNKNTPTNDQLYFTTASAFSALLRTNGIEVSKEAEIALKMFCGDSDIDPLMVIVLIKIESLIPVDGFMKNFQKKKKKS